MFGPIDSCFGGCHAIRWNTKPVSISRSYHTSQSHLTVEVEAPKKLRGDVDS